MPTRNAARYQPGLVEQFLLGREARMADAEAATNGSGVDFERRAQDEQPIDLAGLEQQGLAADTNVLSPRGGRLLGGVGRLVLEMAIGHALTVETIADSLQNRRAHKRLLYPDFPRPPKSTGPWVELLTRARFAILSSAASRVILRNKRFGAQ